MSMEKRKLKRRHLIYYLTVQDTETNQVLGFLVDITTRGVMLMSDNPIEPGTDLSLKILLQTEMSSREYLYFDARAVWCEKSINENSYDTGLELLNVAPEDFREIEKIIEELGFNN
ncbi:PilZ domain-containing protein [Thermodesulfobacteriota bacterium]